MKKMFLFTAPDMPAIVRKAETQEEAVKGFFEGGFDPEYVEKLKVNPNFKVRPLTLELLDEITSGDEYKEGEFTFSSDTGF